MRFSNPLAIIVILTESLTAVLGAQTADQIVENLNEATSEVRKAHTNAVNLNILNSNTMSIVGYLFISSMQASNFQFLTIFPGHGEEQQQNRRLHSGLQQAFAQWHGAIATGPTDRSCGGDHYCRYYPRTTSLPPRGEQD